MKHIGFWIWMCAIGTLHAQDVLPAEEVVRRALQQQYQIILAQSQREILQQNATRGAAGQLPSLSLSSGASYSNTSIRQEFASGLELVRNGVNANAVNGALQFSWVVFQGQKLRYTYSRLQAEAQGGEIALRKAIEQTTYQVLQQYYQLVQLRSDERVLIRNRETIAGQVEIAEARYRLGQSDLQTLLQTRVALNRAEIAVLESQGRIRAAQAALNTSMGLQPETALSVSDSLRFEPLPEWEALRKQVETSNIDVMLQENGIQVQQFKIREAGAARAPMLLLGGQYNLNRNQSDGGFSLYNFSQGPGLGLSLQWNLFNGHQVKRQIARERAVGYQYEQLLRDIRLRNASALWQSWENYRQASRILQLEQSNYDAAQQVFDIANARFQGGLASVLEWNDARYLLDAALHSRSTARLAMKNAELELSRLAGVWSIAK